MFFLPPASSWPDMVSVLTARQAGRPPRAATLRSTICAAVSEAAGAPSTAAVAAAGINATAVHAITKNRLIIFPPPLVRLGLLDQQAVDAIGADDHGHPLPGLDDVALVRKHHPVFLTLTRWARLPQLPDLVHYWNLQNGAAAGADEVGLRLLVRHRLGALRVDDAIAEADQVAGVGATYLELVDAAKRRVTVLPVLRHAVRTIRRLFLRRLDQRTQRKHAARHQGE